MHLFLIIVGALAFFFYGIPLIIGLIGLILEIMRTKEFWIFAGVCVVFIAVAVWGNSGDSRHTPQPEVRHHGRHKY
jgi:hypothetical protein